MTIRDSTRNRLFILAGIFILVLLVVLIKLWSMQVIQGKEYAKLATANRTAEVTTIAPRGRILDRNGKVLVDNRVTKAVVADTSVKTDPSTLSRLSNLLGIPASAITMRMEDSRESALAPKVIAYDPSDEVVAYIAEHQDLFKGVTVEPRTVRTYPFKTLAAHVLGYTGGISDEELKKKSFIDYSSGDIVGKSGVESQYESILQGDRGVKKVEVDANGRVLRSFDEVPPVPGRDIELTIDVDTQKLCEKALQDALGHAHKLGFNKANAGSVVAMSTKTGEVLGMASAPTYNPETFINGISEEEWKTLTDKKAGSPLTNRAISAAYPPASTFKAFVGMASLSEGIATANSSFYCAGTWTGMGDEWPKKCWKTSGHGSIGFTSAIAQSCDIAFYEMGYRFYKTKTEALQQYIRSWGYGSKTEIDLPSEVNGRVPDKKWKEEFYEDFPESRGWLPGDTVNMSIGQGDVLATPLQIATTYAGIANNGSVMKPHVFKAALDADGKAVIDQKPEVLKTPKISKANLGTIQNALRQVVTQGTARSAFAGMEVATAGKSGTAEVQGKDDYALYVGYAPYDDPEYCVAVVIEQGGGGGAVATSACREVLSGLLGLDTKFVETGTDHSR